MPTETRSARSQRRMIDAAERLIAERGTSAVAARDVLEAAGQRNKAAISYHFGNWDGLVEAILEARMAEVSQRRAELLDAVDEHVAASTRQLVEVLVLPFAERCISDAASCWARFLYRCMSDPHVGRILERSVEGQTFRDARLRLAERIDDVPMPLRNRRVQTAFATAVSSLAEFETRRDSERGSMLPVEVVLSDLVDVAVAIIDAPASARTLDLVTSATNPDGTSTDDASAGDPNSADVATDTTDTTHTANSKFNGAPT